MKLVFVSNYFNHHQKPLAEAFIKEQRVDYTFIATSPVSESRKKLGYEDMDKSYEYVVRAYESEEALEKSMALCMDADVVIYGSCPIKFIKPRLKAKKPTFKYSERLFKSDAGNLKKLLFGIKFRQKEGKYKNNCLLCSSGYAAEDYNGIGAFRGRTYKWGYFPEFIEYGDENKIAEEKTPDSIIWVGRFIDWKHPELAVNALKFLRREGYDFDLTMVGNGEDYDKIIELVRQCGLDDKVKFVGSKPNHEVRLMLEKAQIALITSDKKEGWGAIINESMNACAAVICNKEVGAAPFLIEDGKNGFVYGSEEEFFAKLKTLADDCVLREELGINAYKTIKTGWNASIAAERFVVLCESILKGEDTPFTEGICSKADRK